MTETALLICGHGSRSPKHGIEFSSLMQNIYGLLPDMPILQAFLEVNQPRIEDGLHLLKKNGASRIIILPAFLFRGGHVKRDIPAILEKFQAENPRIRLQYAPALGEDEQFHMVAESCLQQWGDHREDHSGEHRGQHRGDHNDSLLLTVGRGSSSGTGQAATEKLSRHLMQKMNFADSMTCYAGISQPLLDQALDEIIRKKPARVVVWPCLLFSGLLLDRIETQVREVASNHPAIPFTIAPPLGAQQKLADMMARQVMQLL